MAPASPASRRAPQPRPPWGLLSGVAPGALIGNYRAFDGQGLGRNDLIARALEEAFLDGFRIANLSFGSQARRREDPSCSARSRTPSLAA